MIEPSADNRNALTRRGKRSFVRVRIDSGSKPAYDRYAGGSEIVADIFSDFPAVRRASPRAYDCDAFVGENLWIAAIIKHERRVYFGSAKPLGKDRIEYRNHSDVFVAQPAKRFFDIVDRTETRQFAKRFFADKFANDGIFRKIVP